MSLRTSFPTTDLPDEVKRIHTNIMDILTQEKDIKETNLNISMFQTFIEYDDKAFMEGNSASDFYGERKNLRTTKQKLNFNFDNGDPKLVLKTPFRYGKSVGNGSMTEVIPATSTPVMNTNAPASVNQTPVRRPTKTPNTPNTPNTPKTPKTPKTVNVRYVRTHIKAYLKYLVSMEDRLSRELKTKNNKVDFIRYIIVLTYLSFLQVRFVDSKYNIDFLTTILKNISRIHHKLHINVNKIKQFKFFYNIVYPRLKLFTDTLIHGITKKLETDKNNKKNKNAISIYIQLTKIKRDYNTTIHKKRLFSIERLNILITTLGNLLKSQNKDVEKIISNRKLNKLELKNSDILELKKIGHFTNINKEIEKFKKEYIKYLRHSRYHKNINDLSKVFSNEQLRDFSKNKGYTYSTNLKNASHEAKSEFLREMVDEHIAELQSIKNKDDYDEKLKKIKRFYINVGSIKSKRKFLQLEELIAKKNIKNKNSNLKNLKDQYILNVKQNGPNAIPGNKNLEDTFKSKPAFLREILRVKRTSSSSATPKKIYKDEINYFKKTGKYKPLAAYENGYIIKIKEIEKLHNEIKKLENNINKPGLSNTNKKDINKIISKKKKEVERLTLKRSTQMTNVKSGLINKRKGINIDNETSTMIKKYQSALFKLGIKHLQDSWKSYYNSLTKPGVKYNTSNLKNKYDKAISALKSGYGNGFINKYSPSVYKELMKYKKITISRMQKIRKDVAKAKSPKRRIKLVRKK